MDLKNQKPVTTRNRGKKSNDDQDFAPKWWPVFRTATDDFCYLLSRGYAENSIIQMVGNRYRLNSRQRMAIRRMSVSDQQIQLRQSKECSRADLAGKVVDIDGFNLLILLESALSGAYLFQGRDGLYRDLSSVHGSYKRVQKTSLAIELIGEVLEACNIQQARWYLDQPVSNSGRLKVMLIELSHQRNWNWEVELVFDPDKVLAKSKSIVISSDGWILNQAQGWFNLGRSIIETQVKNAMIIKA